MEETLSESPESVTLDYDLTTEDSVDVDTSQFLTYGEDGSVQFDLEAYKTWLDEALEEAKTYGYEYDYDFDDDDEVETYTEVTPSSGTVKVTTGSAADLAAVWTVIAGAMIPIVLISLAFSVYTAIVNFKISKKMGRETWFGVLAIFFWPIMSGILAFSKEKKPIESAEALPPSDLKPEPSPVPDFSKPASESAEPSESASPEEPAAPETPVPENPQPEM